MGPLKSSLPPAEEGVRQISGPATALSSKGSADGSCGKRGCSEVPENKVKFIFVEI